jgi:hypothetical protein
MGGFIGWLLHATTESRVLTMGKAARALFWLAGILAAFGALSFLVTFPTSAAEPEAGVPTRLPHWAEIAHKVGLSLWAVSLALVLGAWLIRWRSRSDQ